MTSGEVTVIVVGLLVGYGIVSRLYRTEETGTAGNAKTESSARTETSQGRQNQREPESPRAVNWNDVLGVPLSADVAEIKSAYKRLMIQYHPDKVASLGPELRELAELKTREITSAYQQAIRGRA